MRKEHIGVKRPAGSNRAPTSQKRPGFIMQDSSNGIVGSLPSPSVHRRFVYVTTRGRPYCSACASCQCAHGVWADLGDRVLDIVCEHITQYQVGHMCGGRRSLGTQDNNVYVPAVPHTGYARRGYGVIIQLGRHRQGVSPWWMVNAARLRWTLSPLRNVSFDSKSCTV